MKKKLFCLVAMFFAVGLHAFAAEWEKPVPSSSQLANGQSYYLYISSVGKYLRAQGVVTSLADEGSLITFALLSGEDWMLEGPNGYLYSDLEFVGGNGGASDANTSWFVERQAGGTFHIRPSKEDPDYSWALYPDMWMGLSYEKSMITPLLKADEGDIDWYLIAETEYGKFQSKVELHRAMTELQDSGLDISALLAVYNDPAAEKADYDKALESVADVLVAVRMKNATEDNPFDVTSLYMRNADLTEDWVNDGHDVPGWTMEPSYFCGMGESDAAGFYNDNKVLGSWSGSAFGDNKVYQQLENLPHGKYKFSNYGIWIRHTGEEGDPITGAYIYAKVGKKLFREPLPDTGWSSGLGEVVFECRTGEAEVGIMFEGTNVGQCVIMDFKLDYLGEKPAAERLSALIENAQALIEEDAINAAYVDKLNSDISKARDLIAGGDADAQEALFTEFTEDYEAAMENKAGLILLSELVNECMSTLMKGESEEMDALSDYLYENEVEEKVAAKAYDNAQIEELINVLMELNDKAKNSVIAVGADVTDLLVNGRFDGTGGWIATLNDFSIDTNKKIMERWWCDWMAEQVVENVPNGTYRLEVQGFQWCSWDWSASESDWNEGDGTPTYKVNSKIRLNDSEVTIHNVFACGKTDIQEGYQANDYYVPNDANVAVKFFDLGLYNNVVEATVTDHKLKVVFDCSANGFWNCFKNLRLYYVEAGEDTGVRSLEPAKVRQESGTYNLMGVKVNTPSARGIYIRNGKKYVK